MPNKKSKRKRYVKQKKDSFDSVSSRNLQAVKEENRKAIEAFKDKISCINNMEDIN